MVHIRPRFAADVPPPKAGEKSDGAPAPQPSTPGQTFFTPNPFPLKLEAPKSPLGKAGHFIKGLFFPSKVLSVREQRLDDLLDQYQKGLEAGKVISVNPNPKIGLTYKVSEIQIDPVELKIDGQLYRYQHKYYYSDYDSSRNTSWYELSKDSPAITIRLDSRLMKLTFLYPDKGLEITTGNRYLRKKAKRMLLAYGTFIQGVARQWQAKLGAEQREKENKLLGTLEWLERDLKAGKVHCKEEHPKVILNHTKEQVYQVTEWVGPVALDIEGQPYKLEKCLGYLYEKDGSYDYYSAWKQKDFAKLTGEDGSFCLTINNWSSNGCDLFFQDKGVKVNTTNRALVKRSKKVIDQYCEMLKRMDEIRLLKKEAIDDEVMKNLKV